MLNSSLVKRLPLFFLALTLLNGCASTNFREPIAARAIPECNPEARPTAETPGASTQPELPQAQTPLLCRLDGGFANELSSRELVSPFWTPVSLELAADAPSRAVVEGQTENLFSWDYFKLVLLDIQETFTAPARWETRDWLVFGGVTASIGTVMVFDQDIQRAVQRARNNTINNVFNAVQPFGNEYAPAVLGAFYFGGLVFKDDRASAVALDGISASIISSGLITVPMK
jgi:hypothetical protein